MLLLLLGDAENVEKMTKRLVKVTKEHNEECKALLKLMGIPYVDVSIEQGKFICLTLNTK